MSGSTDQSQRFDREAIDVFAIQDEIAAGVVDAVKARLGPCSRTVHARPQAREIDEAFDVLARTEEEHQELLCYTGLPGFDALRSEPRFAALMRRLELSPW